MEPDDLEETLAVNNLANALHTACGEELFGLNQRLAVLLNQRELATEDNPVGPELVAKALHDTLKDQGGSLKLRLVLASMLNKHLPERVKGVYQSLNRFLVDKGVLPTLRIGLRRGAKGTASGAEKEQGSNTMPDVDLLDVLRQLLGGVGQGAGPTAAAAQTAASGSSPTAAHAALASAQQSGAVVNAVPVFVHTLTQLQRGQTDSLALRGLDASRLGDGQTNILRELKHCGVTEGLGHLDGMTLDIVALIFDYILDDRRVPDAMKALIGRLQIPVLKVAMLDRNFFSHKAHPARRLLDTLAEASMGWDAQEGHESGLYRKVDEIVQRILNEFDDKLDVFQVALEDLIAYLAEEKRQIDNATARGAQLLYTREQREIAEVVAYDTVHTQLFGHDVPALIQEFLYGTWRQLLTLIYSQDGEDSEVWRGAVQTMSDLIWSVAPKTTAEERKLLVQRLPGMLKRLSDGFKTLQTAKEEQDRFFAALVKCHAEAVKNGMKGPQAEAAAGAPPSAQPIAPAQPGADTPLDFEQLPLPSEDIEIAPTLLQEVSALPIVGEPEETEEITSTDVAWTVGPASAGDRYDAMVRQLKRGRWIEYWQEDGSLARAKLAWISPMKGIYLFTNRLGQRAMSINASGLAAKLRAGQIHLIDDAPLMERAMDALMSKLRNTA